MFCSLILTSSHLQIKLLILPVSQFKILRKKSSLSGLSPMTIPSTKERWVRWFFSILFSQEGNNFYRKIKIKRCWTKREKAPPLDLGSKSSLGFWSVCAYTLTGVIYTQHVPILSTQSIYSSQKPFLIKLSNQLGFERSTFLKLSSFYKISLP